MSYIDETKYMPDEANNESPVNPLENGDVTSLSEQKDKRIGVKLGVVAAGAALVAGTGATFAVNHFMKSSDGDEQGAEQGAPINGIRVATTVTDDLSYAQAFDAARAEVGAGGCFVWHGGVYGTYTQTEWAAMSPDEQAEFTGLALSQYQTQDEADENVSTGDYAQNTTETPQHNEGSMNGIQRPIVNSATAHHEDLNASEGATELDVLVTDEDIDVSQVDDETGVHFIGTQEVMTDNGLMTVGAANVDGTDVMLVDVDHDGTFDVMLADVNGDGEISDSEIFELSSPILVENFKASMELGEGGDAEALDNTVDFGDENLDADSVYVINGVESTDEDILSMTSTDDGYDSASETANAEHVLDADEVMPMGEAVAENDIDVDVNEDFNTDVDDYSANTYNLVEDLNADHSDYQHFAADDINFD